MPSNPPVVFFIAFAGKKQVGKSTAGNFVKDLLRGVDKKTVVTAFASPLKEMCIDILGLSRELVYGSDQEKNMECDIRWEGFSTDIRLKYASAFTFPRVGRMTVREVLQVMGTDVFRAIDGDVWARAPFRKNWADADVVVLADCRFPNEVQAVLDNGGVVIHLERETGLQDNHASETALDGYAFEHKYANNGSLDELKEFVRNQLTKLKLL